MLGFSTCPGVAHTQDEADSTPSPSGRGLQPWSATHWATLIWAAGKMAWQPQQQLWAVLQSAVERHKADFKPQELANMLWCAALSVHMFRKWPCRCECGICLDQPVV